MLAVVAQTAPADQPLLLAGFSFGGFIAARAIDTLHPQRAIAGAVLVGTAASRFDVPPVPAELHPQTLVVHGEQDDTVPPGVRHGLGAPAVAAGHRGAGRRALLPRTITAAQGPGGAPCVRLSFLNDLGLQRLSSKRRQLTYL